MIENAMNGDGVDPTDGGEGDLPPGYDAGFMGDALSPEDYNSQPDPLKARFQRFARKNSELKAQLEAERQQTMAMNARLAVLESSVNKPADKPKEGIAAYSDADLKAWKAKALRAQQAYFMDPTNEEAKAAVAAINPDHLIAVDEELVERRARAVASESTSALKGEWQGRQAQETFNTRISAKYGTEYVRPGTPQNAAAKAEFAELARDFDITPDNAGAYTVLAIERAVAKAAGNRDGQRGGDASLRRLAIEGQGRREAQFGNSVAALQAKGDWQSQSKATDIQLDAFLNANFGS